MKVLIVKTTSMGDVIHTLPAVTDAARVIPGIEFDWVVELPFAEIPSWHPSVKKVIPVQMRQWRKHWLKTLFSDSWKAFRKDLKSTKYDLIIDAQGLVKSAVLAWQARGQRCGLDRRSAWESFASLFYQKKVSVNPDQHAVTRVRQLFAKALGYEIDENSVDFGIDRNRFVKDRAENPYVIFLHGTTWVTKHYPEAYWLELCESVTELGVDVKLPWGNEIEKQRAERIAAISDRASVLPKLNIAGVAKELAGAKAVLSVDTGLGHLASALDVPCLSMYGPTDPAAIGTRGPNQFHLKEEFKCGESCSQKNCALAKDISPACFANMVPEKVMAKFRGLL